MAFLLTILSLFVSWASAFLLAAVTTQLTFASGLINAPVLRLFRPQGKNAYIKGLQKIIFIFIWIEWIVLISRQLGISESLHQARDFSKLRHAFLVASLELLVRQPRLQAADDQHDGGLCVRHRVPSVAAT